MDVLFLEKRLDIDYLLTFESERKHKKNGQPSRNHKPTRMNGWWMGRESTWTERKREKLNSRKKANKSQEKWKFATRDFAYLFFSPCGRTLGASGSLRLFLACASASSSHAWRIGFNAIMLLCDNVRLSNLQIVLCERAPTPGSLRFASALPTSAWVTPSFVANRSPRREVEGAERVFRREKKGKEKEGERVGKK